MAMTISRTVPLPDVDTPPAHATRPIPVAERAKDSWPGREARDTPDVPEARAKDEVVETPDATLAPAPARKPRRMGLPVVMPVVVPLVTVASALPSALALSREVAGHVAGSPTQAEAVAPPAKAPAQAGNLVGTDAGALPQGRVAARVPAEAPAATVASTLPQVPLDAMAPRVAMPSASQSRETDVATTAALPVPTGMATGSHANAGPETGSSEAPVRTHLPAATAPVAVPATAADSPVAGRFSYVFNWGGAPSVVTGSLAHDAVSANIGAGLVAHAVDGSPRVMEVLASHAVLSAQVDLLDKDTRRAGDEPSGGRQAPDDSEEDET